MAAQHRSATDQTLAVLALRPLTAGVSLEIELISLSVLSKPYQQISQSVSHQNGNPARTNNVSYKKHRRRCDHRAIHSAIPRTPYRAIRHDKQSSSQSRSSLLPKTRSPCLQVRLAGSAETHGGFGAPLPRCVAGLNSGLR